MSLPTLKVLDLFSGIGGISYGLQTLCGGFEPVAFCEIDPWCREILKRHWPGLPVFEDVRNVSSESVRSLGRIDAIVGGFPCQPFSVAGKQKGTEDKRHLWPEMYRIIREIRPTWVLAENVPGLRTIAADQVLADLEAAGYSCWASVVGAHHVGANHRRNRVWVVGHLENTDLCDRHSNGMEGWDSVRRAEPVSKGIGESGHALADADCNGEREQSRAFSESKPRPGGSLQPLPDQPGHVLDDRNLPGSGIACEADQGEGVGGQGVGNHRPLGSAGSGASLADSDRLRRRLGRESEPGGEQGPCGHEPDGCGERGAGGEDVAHGHGHGRPDSRANQERQERRGVATGRSSARAPLGPWRWPAGRGQPQHDWEPPRTIALPPAPCTVDFGLARLPSRLARSWNRAALKAVGNSVVPQVVAVVGRAILELWDAIEAETREAEGTRGEYQTR